MRRCVPSGSSAKPLPRRPRAEQSRFALPPVRREGLLRMERFRSARLALRTNPHRLSARRPMGAGITWPRRASVTLVGFGLAPERFLFAQVMFCERAALLRGQLFHAPETALEFRVGTA